MGGTIRYLAGGGGGAKVCACLYLQREMESYMFTPQDRLYFHHALRRFLYFTNIFPQKYLFPKASSPPPLQYSNGGPLICHGSMVLALSLGRTGFALRPINSGNRQK